MVHKKACPTDTSKTTPKRRLLKVILQQDSSPLQDFFDNNEQIYPFSRDQRLEISSSIASALYDWTITNPSLPLAIEDARTIGLPGRLTLVSACYTSVARQHNIPVISHFCASSPSPRLSKKAGLIALVYSLIRQLIELAPPMLNCDSNSDLSGERFRRLNGTTASWTDAISILDTLLQYRPPVLFCVIDALDILEDGATTDEQPTEHYVQSLVTMLASHTRPPAAPPQDVTTVTTVTTTTNTNTNASSISTSTQQSPCSTGLFKLLFTTAGQCKAIQSVFVAQEQGRVLTTDTTHIKTIDEDVSMVDA